MARITSNELQNAIVLLEEDLKKKTNRTAQENQLLSEIQAKDYSSTGMLGQFLQGVTRRGYDEISAIGDKNPMLVEALRNNPNLQGLNREPITDYDVALALKRSNLQKQGSKNPISSTLVEGGGAITSALPLAFTPAGKYLMPTTKRGAFVGGAAEGGLSSFLGGEDTFKDRMENVPLDAVFSGLLGSTFTGLANIAQPLFKRLIPRTDASIGKTTAVKIVNNALKNENTSFKDVLEEVAKKNNPSFTIGDANDSLANLAEGIMLMPNTVGKRDAEKFFKARSEGRLGRLINIFHNVKGGNFADELKALERRRGDASDLYKKVFKTNKKMSLDFNMDINGQNIKLTDLLNQSVMEDALISAQKIAKNIDPNFNIRFIRNKKGDVIKIQTADKKGRFNDIVALDSKIMHYIKLGLDDATSKLGRTDSSTGKILTRQAYDTKNKFNSLLDAFNPAYKEAKNQYSEIYSLTDSMLMGRNLKKVLTNPAELELLEENLKYMGKADKEAFFLGAMQFYKDTIDTATGTMKAKPETGRNIAEKLIENPTAIRLLKAVYPGNEEQFTKFLGNLKDEALMQANTAKATGGSPTAFRTELKELIEENIPSELLNADNLYQVFKNAVGDSLQVKRNKITDETSKELFNILFTTAQADPKKLNALKSVLGGKLSFRRLINEYPEFLSAIVRGPLSPQVASAIQTNTGIGDATREGAKFTGQAFGGLFGDGF